MWIPRSLLALFDISRETVESLRLEASSLRAENAILQRELVSNKIMSDWLRMQVNSLTLERVKLIERAYPGLNLQAPEIARVSNKVKDGFDLQALFEDAGDEAAKLPFIS